MVQARTGSTRLPGKVLRHIAGRPLIGHQLARLATCHSLDSIVVATTTSREDDTLAQYCSAEGFAVYRGSGPDVLDRVVRAAESAAADVVVRVTADCPLIDPTVTDRVVDDLIASSGAVDYCSNVIRRTYPRGLDTEALFLDALHRAGRMAQTVSDREHVTTFIRFSRPDLFATHSVEAAKDDSDLRWTVDEERDFELVNRLFTDLSLDRDYLPYSAVVDHVRSHPELARINGESATWEPMRGAQAHVSRESA